MPDNSASQRKQDYAEPASRPAGRYPSVVPDWGVLPHREADVSPRVCQLLRRSEEHTSELQSRGHLVCRLLLEKKQKSLREYDQRMWRPLPSDVIILHGVDGVTERVQRSTTR